jgi:D-glycerate 3-kinase
MTVPPDWLRGFLDGERLPDGYARVLDLVAAPLVEKIVAHPRPLVVGLCGTQGSGKSTLALALQRMLALRGVRAAVLSIDDLYLKREEREALATAVHPLLITRGPPGTHDVALGLDVLDRLLKPGEVALPRFDKALDTRKPFDQWDVVQGPVDVVIFEGWCVGAQPEEPGALSDPINVLERDEDQGGVWRTCVNDALAGPYQTLFARIGLLVMLRALSFEVVLKWRIEQEHKLKARLMASGGDMARTMSDEEIARFIAHYERVTRHILAEMPDRADVVVNLDEGRQVLAVS